MSDGLPIRLGSPTALFDSVTREITNFGERLLDRQLRLAITGLRRSGKTVFTTSLIHHLLAGYDLPFLNAAHEKRLLGARIRRTGETPFPFEAFETALKSGTPTWPKPTDDLTELRLELRFESTSWMNSLISPFQTFEIDIIDYPGEWLLDLPLLKQDFATFSQIAMAQMNDGLRIEASANFRGQLDRNDVDGLLETYRDFLASCQFDLGLAFIQPGRLVHGFDALRNEHAFCPLPPGHQLFDQMQDRFQQYVDDLVRPFIQDHFATFDRQVVLVDLLTCLNSGPDHFADTQHALAAILESFSYGQNSWWSHLFAPRIERILFAASKADHVAANQHANLKQLLELIVAPARQRAKFEGIDYDVLALSALRATDTVRTEHNGQILSCVRGRLKLEDRDTVLFPGEIPAELPTRADWENGIFRFHEFAPRSLKDGVAGQHIRLDQAIEFLIGDKLT